jgi:hypothetical protein
VAAAVGNQTKTSTGVDDMESVEWLRDDERMASPEDPADAGSRYRLFLSHAHADVDVVLQVAAELEGLGLTTFVASTNIERSTDWLRAIDRELHICDALVAFLTPAARQSEWVDQEIGVALGRRLRVIPVRLNAADGQPHGFLRLIQAADARVPVTRPEGVLELAFDIFDALFQVRTDRVRLLPCVFQGLARERRLAPLRRWADLVWSARQDLDQDQRALLAEYIQRNTALRTDRVAHAKVTRAREL